MTGAGVTRAARAPDVPAVWGYAGKHGLRMCLLCVGAKTRGWSFISFGAAPSLEGKLQTGRGVGGKVSPHDEGSSQLCLAQSSPTSRAPSPTESLSFHRAVLGELCGFSDLSDSAGATRGEK